MRVSRYLTALCVILTFAACGNNLSSADDGLNGFAAGPYLLDVTDNSATVAFHLDKPLSARVRVLGAEKIGEFKSQVRSKSHFVKITGLESGLVYNYEVICGDEEIRTPESDRSLQIRTACRDGESFTFAVYGDTRPGENKTTRYHQDVIEQIILHEPVFCLVLGDMVDDGEKTELWEEFFRIESKLLCSSAIYTVMGDNDYAQRRGLFARFFPKLEKGYYRFEWGGVQFFGLHAWDTRGEQRYEEIDAQSPQIQWLESELSREEVQAASFRVIFVHDPVYISRGKSSEVLRRIWAPIFQKYGVDVVFSSWHLYERSQNEGITYISSGGGGAELIWMKKDPTYPSLAEACRHHFCRVDVTSNTMVIRAIATDGTVLDAITLTPRPHDLGVAEGIERAAKRLSKEILINEEKHNAIILLYLFSYDCGECRKIVEQYLPRLAEQNQVTLKIFYFDLGTEGTYDLFLNAGAEFGRQDADIPAVFIGRSVLGGETEIETMLSKQIADFLEDPQHYSEQSIVPFQQSYDTSLIGEEAFKMLTYGSVFNAGILDGLNPRALITVLVLVSYLVLVGETRRHVFYGGLFISAVFLTYIGIGLAFFEVTKLNLRQQVLADIANSLLLVFLAVLAGFAVVDFIRCLRGSAIDIPLQLPESLKRTFRGKRKNAMKSKIAMVTLASVFGVVTAVMASAYTGKVYIKIVTMIPEPRHRIAATSYLFAYSITFALPVIAAFILAILVITSKYTKAFFTRHVAMAKFGFVALFTSTAIITFYNLGSLL